jgi:large subunit ribosomal protein L23
MAEEVVLIKPIVSEKSLNQTALSLYTFAVAKWATKWQIKKAVEKAFNVKVLSVKTAKVKGKKNRVGKYRLEIKRSDWKKAFVKLPPDQKIEVFESAGKAESTPK